MYDNDEILLEIEFRKAQKIIMDIIEKNKENAGNEKEEKENG